MQPAEITALIKEAFLTRLLPLFDEVTFNAIRSLRMQDYLQAAIWSGVGALAASLLLYAVGIWLRRMPSKVSTPEQQARIGKLKTAADEWLPWMLILSPTPIGGMLVMAAGFFAIRPWKVLTMLLVAEFAWRGAPLF